MEGSVRQEKDLLIWHLFRENVLINRHFWLNLNGTSLHREPYSRLKKENMQERWKNIKIIFFWWEFLTTERVRNMPV